MTSKNNTDFYFLVAVLIMFVDHCGAYFFPDYLIFRIIGRIGLLIWCFFLAQGMRYTRNKYDYLSRLLLTACLTQIPYMFVTGAYDLNALFFLFLAGCFIASGRDFFLCSVIAALAFVLAFRQPSLLLFFVFSIIIYYRQYNFLIPVAILLYVFSPVQLYLFSGVLVLYISQKYSFHFRLPKIFKYSVYPLHYVLILFIQIFI